MRVLKKVFWLILGFSIFGEGVFAQKKGNVKGYVLDQTDQKPIPDVIIFLDGKWRTTLFNDGSFTFSGVTPGEHQLYILAPNYKSLTHSFSLQEGENKSLGILYLKPDTIQIPSVDIVAKPDQTLYLDQVTPVEMRQIHPIMTEEVLRGVSGIHVAGDMGLSQRLNIGIRGSYPRRSEKILIMEDGIPAAPAPYLAPEAYYNTPIEFVHRIEVIKGPDLIKYGPQTLFGAINYITNSPPTHPEASVRIELGQRNYQSFYFNYGNKWNNFASRIQLLRRHFDGFRKNGQSDLLGAKANLFALLTPTQSLYAKLGYYSEKSQSTYAGVTPFTFQVDPTQNPFDTDLFLGYRYEFALKHLWIPRQNLNLTTSAYASQFVRDWTRQNTTFIPAQQVKAYVGETRFQSHYSYLQNVTPTEDAYVIVGKITNGRESATGRNRIFKIAGAMSDLHWTLHPRHQFNAGIKYHTEAFRNVKLLNDSNKVAFTGIPEEDLLFTLHAKSGYLLYRWTQNRLSINTGFRYECLTYMKEDLWQETQDPNFTGTSLHTESNQYTIFLPSFSFHYTLLQNSDQTFALTGGIYRGYNPPTTEFGIVTEFGIEEGEITKLKVEKSWHSQFGLQWRKQSLAQIEIMAFSNLIQNYYSPGRHEAFETVGSAQMSGIESNIFFPVHEWLQLPSQWSFTIQNALTFMQSKLLGGTLVDGDLLKAIHTEETKQEIIEKLNASPSAFTVYGPNDSILSGPFTLNDFSNLKKIKYHFGKGILASNQAPYVPSILLTSMATLGYRHFECVVRYTYVGAQYTDYLNLIHETAEGGIGRLDPYSILDVNLSYQWIPGKSAVKSLRLYVVGKNVLDQVYKASRLHRITSGIMVAGFRQITGGIELTF